MASTVSPVDPSVWSTRLIVWVAAVQSRWKGTGTPRWFRAGKAGRVPTDYICNASRIVPWPRPGENPHLSDAFGVQGSFELSQDGRMWLSTPHPRKAPKKKGRVSKKKVVPVFAPLNPRRSSRTKVEDRPVAGPGTCDPVAS